MQWRKVTIVGVGLLGGSLGLALRQRSLANRVTGLVRREASVIECRQLGVVDDATLDPREAVADADLVVLCTPIAQMASLTKQILPALRKGAIVTDVGSVKSSVVSELEPMLAEVGARFIGSHPMAGAEKMGASAARADLFRGAVCVVTPTEQSNSQALEAVTELWRDAGCRPMRMSAQAHDELVSRSSHLPHVMAARLAGYILDPTHGQEQPELCANGFRDTTRIASGSPEMWRDIAMANRENLIQSIKEFSSGLDAFRRALEQGDETAVEGFFAEARERREHWRNQNSSRE